VGDKFEWQPTFDALLEQTATTNIVECVTLSSGAPLPIADSL
jgi:hypothetical protein